MTGLVQKHRVTYNWFTLKGCFVRICPNQIPLCIAGLSSSLRNEATTGLSKQLCPNSEAKPCGRTAGNGQSMSSKTALVHLWSLHLDAKCWHWGPKPMTESDWFFHAVYFSVFHTLLFFVIENIDNSTGLPWQVPSTFPTFAVLCNAARGLEDQAILQHVTWTSIQAQRAKRAKYGWCWPYGQSGRCGFSYVFSHVLACICPCHIDHLPSHPQAWWTTSFHWPQTTRNLRKSEGNPNFSEVESCFRDHTTFQSLALWRNLAERGSWLWAVWVVNFPA